MNRFEIISECNTKVRKFNLIGRKICFKIKSLPNNENPLSWVKESVSDVIKYLKSNIDEEAFVGLTFSSNQFKEKKPGYLSFRRLKNLTDEDVWFVLGSIFQSNSSTGLNTDTFTISMTYVDLPRGQSELKFITTLMKNARKEQELF